MTARCIGATSYNSDHTCIDHFEETIDRILSMKRLACMMLASIPGRKERGKVEGAGVEAEDVGRASYFVMRKSCDNDDYHYKMILVILF